jgi:peptidoglycan/LPS O-acetylase OafA/YrhL
MPAIASAHLLIIPQVVFGFFYFILGVISVAQVKRLGLVSAIVATLVFIGWMVTFRLLHLGGAFGTILLIPAATAGIVATLAWSRQLARLRGPLTVRLAGLLAFLGRYSMSIYVLHIFFTAGVRILLKRLGTHDTLAGTVLELTAATVLGLLIPLGINWMISKARADRWFGLQHMEAAR